MSYKTLFLDTETTGNTEKDRLCQVAYNYDGVMHESLFKPPLSIPPEASAVCHITDKMVADKEPFKGTTFYHELADKLNLTETVLVAHNAQFDVGMLNREDLEVSRYICTLKVARALDTNGTIPRYNLQYLRYYLGMEIDAVAHDALGDVLVLVELFERLTKKIMDQGLSRDEAIERMIRITREPSMILRFSFGKYNGELVQDVAQKDRGYLEWLLRSKMEKPEGEEDWIFTLESYLK